MLIGHQSQIGHAGDYFVGEVADESVIVVRDRESMIRGFYNICRHRGTRLCEDEKGHSAAIQCPYHAWTYGLDGKLIGAPHMDGEAVPGFNKADYSLHDVALALWEGFIFVALADSPMPLEEWFAPLAGKFAQWNLSNLRSAKRIEYDVLANWKLIFENYSECYHCPGVHPMLAKVSPYDSAENDLTDGPFLGGSMTIREGKSLTMSGNACARPLTHEHVSNRPHEREDMTAAKVFYYSIFPNMLLSIHPDYVMVHQICPQSPGRTVVQCDWFFHPEAGTTSADDPRRGFTPEDAIEFWDITNRQDWHVCELSQRGIASRAYEPGPYSSRETIPAAWDQEYLRRMEITNIE